MKKNKEEIAAQGAASVDADKLMQKAEVESRYRRNFLPVWKIVIAVISVAFISYHLYTARFGMPEAIKHRALHVGFILGLVWLYFPATSKSPKDRPSFVDIGLFLVTVVVTVYTIISRDAFLIRAGVATLDNYIFGGILILLIEETGLGSGEAETSLRLLPDFKYQVITSGPYDRIISMPDQEVGTNNASGDWTPIPGVLLDDTYSWNTTTKAVKYEYIEETNGNPSQKYSISYDPTTKTGVFLLDFDCTGNDIMSMTLREDPENSGNNGAFVYNQMRYTYTDDEGDEILSTYSIKGYAADNGGKLLLSCAWGAGIDREVREYDFTFDQMSYGSFSDPTLIAKAELSDDEILELRGYSEEASGIALEETRELTGAEVDKPILFFKDQLVFTGSSTTSGTYETLSTPNPLPKEVAVGDCSEADLVNILLLDVGFSGEAYAYKIIPNEADQKKTELVYLGHLNIDPQV